ncbi:histidine kinase [Actinomyces sp.]|uniref:sensor histidine kinase n=1 Tax=Actinomyces sp. TaxID=29317 RepID=UPI0025B94419|nr:histidine kinase [Actinomyces sp.]
MKERLISLAWAAPWMLFMGFPLAYALELPDPAQRAGLIGLCALVAVVNSATWLANPLPARNSFTRPFILSHAALAAATVTYLVYAVSVDTPHAFMLTSYLLVAWVFQAPGRFIVAGLVPVTAIAGVAAYAQGEPLWMGWYLVLLCVFVGVARWRMERSAREHLRRQDAIQRAKAAERARLSTDLHDILGHSLTGITMISELAGRLLEAGRVEEAREQIRAVTAQSNEALADVRRIVAAARALSPGEELEEARSLLEVARIDAEITNEGEPPSGPRSAAAAHVIREGVTNAILHARPSWVRVRLSPDGVTVTNDGYSAAYAASSAGSGSGLAGLSELVGDEGTLTWGASGSTWTLALSFDGAPDAHSS